MTWTLSPSPNHWGPRARTAGIVVHSTRGGASSQEREYTATLGWFANPASQVSAHRVIGFDGNGAKVVDDDNQAWHALSYNPEWLGVELTQPRITDPFSEAQYVALRVLLREWSERYGFTLDRDHIKGHNEIQSGKSDPGPMFDWDQLEETMADYGFPGFDLFDTLVQTIGADKVGAPLHAARYTDFTSIPAPTVKTTETPGQILVTVNAPRTLADARIVYQTCQKGKLEAVKLDDGNWVGKFYPSA